ncbi:hypothetical protein ACWKSP_21180 [Micromonosporaceae bacterium Da 78-11]
MDVFASTFSPTTLPGTHMSVLRRCVEADDPTVLVARCSRPPRVKAGEFLLLLTRRRLVVTQQTRVLHRLRLHLNANLRHLSNFSWSVDARQQVLELSLTAVDGIREQFVLRLADQAQLWRADELLRSVVQDRAGAAA